MRHVLFLATLVACGRAPLDAPLDLAPPADLAGPDVTMAHGDHYQFVVQRLLLPTRTRDYAIDLDGDGLPDNQLGAFLPPIVDEGWQLQPSIDNVMSKGQAVVLLDLQSADPLLKDDSAVGLGIFRGLPGGTPDFSGQGVFNLDRDSIGATVYGKLEEGSFGSNNPVLTEHPVALTLYVPVLGLNDLLPFTLQGAHVQLTITSGLIVGEVHGSIRLSDIENVVLPAWARAFTTSLVFSPPGQSVTGNWLTSRFDVGGCTSPDGTVAAATDRKIDVCEVLQQPLIQALRTPDVRIYDDQGNYSPNPSQPRKDSVSIGFGFVAVGASY